MLISHRYQLLLIVTLVLGIYYPALFAPFNSVDDLKMVNQLLNIDSVQLEPLFFPKGEGQYYRPVLMLTFLWDTFVWGLQESFMHLENILLHVASTVMLFFLSLQLILLQRIQAPVLPFVSALLFGLHPIATEPVIWISGRTDLLAGLCVLGSLLLFLKSFEQSSVLFSCSGALLLLAGCLSKETALFILPVVLVWCVVPPDDLGLVSSVRHRAVIFVSYALTGICYLTMRFYALSGGDKIVSTVSKGVAESGAAFDVFDIIRVTLKTVGFYFKKLILPVPLNFGIVYVPPAYLWLGLLLCCGLVYCIYCRTTIAYLFLAAFFLVSPAFILPLLQITWTPVAERYVYITSAPFVLAVSLLIRRYLQTRLPPGVLSFVTVLLLIITATITFQRNIIWQDNLTLFEDTVRKSPSFPAARNELAIALNARGKKDEAYQLLLTNSGDDFQPSMLNKIRVYLNKGEVAVAYDLLKKWHRQNKNRESLELLNKINEERLKQEQSASRRQEIWREILDTLQELYKMTGDPFFSYRIGMVQLRLDDKAFAKQSFLKAWQTSPPNSHYRDAARKLAEGL